jgi:hypothetical protein
MHEVTGRFWVKLISAQAFAQYLDHRGFTVRGLADAVAKELIRRGEGTACSPAVIGHLRSGKRNTCKPETARAIERCLGAPPGSLFVPQVSRVSRVTRTAA